MDINETGPFVRELIRNAPVVKTAGENQVHAGAVKADPQRGNIQLTAKQESFDSPVLQKQEVENAVSDLNRFFQAERHNLSFSINETTRDVVIEVKDAETDEVIRQIPPQFIIKLAENLHDMFNEADALGGLLLKDKA